MGGRSESAAPPEPGEREMNALYAHAHAHIHTHTESCFHNHNQTTLLTPDLPKDKTKFQGTPVFKSLEISLHITQMVCFLNFIFQGMFDRTFKQMDTTSYQVLKS